MCHNFFFIFDSDFDRCFRFYTPPKCIESNCVSRISIYLLNGKNSRTYKLNTISLYHFPRFSTYNKWLINCVYAFIYFDKVKYTTVHHFYIQVLEIVIKYQSGIFDHGRMIIIFLTVLIQIISNSRFLYTNKNKKKIISTEFNI